MVERLSVEDRDHLIDCKSCRHGVKWHHDGSQQGCQYFGVGPGRCACPLTHDEAAATHVAAAVAEERERIAQRMLNTVDPLLPGHEVRMACVEITRDES